MKKIFAAILALFMMFSLGMPAFAGESQKVECSVDMEKDFLVETEKFNEYHYISTIRESSPDELAKMGVTKEDAELLLAEFDAALAERASLPDSTLSNMGYSDGEIGLLRAYSGGEELSDAELQAVAGTCTGSIRRISCSARSAEFRYTWVWDKCPLLTHKDASAIRWAVYDPNGHEIGVVRSSYSLQVIYYYMSYTPSSTDSGIADVVVETSEPGLDERTLNMQFPVESTHPSENGIIFETYARSGYMQVTVAVPSGVTNEIHYLYVAGLYGHTTIGLGYPSVSVGLTDISIGFTGNAEIDEIAGKQATIYRNSTTVEYWD